MNGQCLNRDADGHRCRRWVGHDGPHYTPFYVATAGQVVRHSWPNDSTGYNARESP